MKKLITLLLLILALQGYGQIVLTDDSPAHTLECVTTSTSGIDYRITWFDETSSGAGIGSSAPGTGMGEITTATTTTILGAPATATTRTVQSITLTNIGAAENTLTIKVDVSAGAEYNEINSITLKPNESLYYNTGKGWSRSPALTSTVTGRTYAFGKTGTAADAAAYWYGFWKDTGVLGAWVPGTPGLAGRATDGTTTTDAGCIYFPDAGAGKVRYLSEVSMDATVAHAYSLWDVVWVNSGLVVTTTTGQTINSVAFPARDADGTVNGRGYCIGIYAVGALGNAGVVSNSTITYTNNLGTGSRTATLNATVPNNFPATPVIGTVVWFELQAGDEGVQSIQTVTLNTTLTSGTASVFVARKLVDVPVSVANLSFSKQINYGNGVVLYDNACILPFARVSATTATVINGSVTTVER